ncbi:MAG TPA: hypothetical protein VGI66_08715 [Streptosporangiaceae bacterium]|jgi:hypothetical protein
MDQVPALLLPVSAPAAPAVDAGVALAVVDEALEQALITTGLFEDFDVTGKVLRVAPQERADRIRPESAGAGPAAVQQVLAHIVEFRRPR